MSENNMKGPEKQFNAGAVKATVWNNEVMNKEGEKGNYKTIVCERSYKDKAGEWKTTSALRVNDLPKASLVLSKAYEYLSMKE